jgi:hypothetical protein
MDMTRGGVGRSDLRSMPFDEFEQWKILAADWRKKQKENDRGS